MTDKPPIRALLEHYGVEVPTTGRKEIPVRCPVHDESRPSCSVNEDDNLWHCQACGAAGDSWTLIILKEGLTYGAAVSFAENLFGESYGGVPQPARPARAGLSGKSGPGFRPRYKNTPPRHRPLSGNG